jgi:uncharacterized protein involved in exopolysaccharide biosynthesis
MIKIEISGTGEEVRQEMLRLLGLQGLKAPAITAGSEEKNQAMEGKAASARRGRGRVGRKPAPLPAATWTEEEAEKLLKQIKPNAKRIIAELASQPEGYRRSELVQELGSSEQSVRGQLSSVGGAQRRMGGKPSPISHKKVDGEFTYMLDPVVAGVAKQHPAEA